MSDICSRCGQLMQIHQEITNPTVTINSESNVIQFPARLMTTKSCGCATGAIAIVGHLDACPAQAFFGPGVIDEQGLDIVEQSVEE